MSAKTKRVGERKAGDVAKLGDVVNAARSIAREEIGRTIALSAGEIEWWKRAPHSTVSAWLMLANPYRMIDLHERVEALEKLAGIRAAGADAKEGG